MAVTKKPAEGVGDLRNLSLLEAHELSMGLAHSFETASAELASSVSSGAQTGGKEKLEFDVILTGGAKINAGLIKEIMVVTGKNLGQSMQFVTMSPNIIKHGISITEAEDLKEKIENEGGSVAIVNAGDQGNIIEQYEQQMFDLGTKIIELKLAELDSPDKHLAYIRSVLNGI